MSSKRCDLECRCGHLQSEHAGGFARCKRGCGCEELRPRKRGPFVEVLGLVDAGDPPRLAPTWRIQCPRPGCGNIYETRAYRRDLVGRRMCRRCSDALRASKKKKRADAGASRPSDLASLEQLAAKNPHGSRVRYVAGCRCEECRAANNAYARMRGKLHRAGQGDPLVDAARARHHLERLARKGIGRRTIADIAGVPSSSIAAIKNGSKSHCRLSTQAKILKVGADVVTDATLVDAGPVWKKIAWLLAQGYTRGAIARRLGAKRAALQLRRDLVTARTRARVDRLVLAIKEGRSA